MFVKVGNVNINLNLVREYSISVTDNTDEVKEYDYFNVVFVTGETKTYYIPKEETEALVNTLELAVGLI